MTEYFEVLDRDGPARLGELRLTAPVTTPACVDDVLADAGSLWAADREQPAGDESELTILPHRSFPAGTREEVREAFATDHAAVDFPAATVVASDNPTAQAADAYILSDATGVVGHGGAFVEAIINAKQALPADTALICAGVATPRNVALLAYAGVDAVDTKLARIKGSQGKYLTTDDEAFLEDLTELPCACPACQQPRESFDREDCIAHNVNALEAELRRVRERIRAGRLRDYIEGQARHDNWLTAALRELDSQYSYLEARTPVFRTAEISAATSDTLRRVEIQRFAERVTTRYRNRFHQPLVLVPCSARKPYSDSQSHGQFHDAIAYRGHTVSMTSPIGVVPSELELTYPAQQYDSVVTGRWSEDEKQFVTKVLTQYLQRNEYPHIVAHVPDGGYRKIVERATAETALDVTYTVEDHPTDTDSLANLAGALEGEPTFSKRQRQHNTVKAIADYQFGPAAGDALFGDREISMRGRYPKLQIHHNDQQLATMVPQYGLLAMTLAGGDRWLACDAPTKTVDIDGFVPHGSVLAPGVQDASESIRPGDEVVISGPAAFGVGRAEMSGFEMVESTRGVATTVRHVRER